MTISQTPLQEALSKPVMPAFWLGYFQEGFRRDVHDGLVGLFECLNLSKADIAKRLGKKPEQITRWLAGPSNLESDTISDLALAMGYVPRIIFEPANCGSSLKPNQVHAMTEIVQARGSVPPPSDNLKQSSGGPFDRMAVV
jgi:hypothetical protein